MEAFNTVLRLFSPRATGPERQRAVHGLVNLRRLDYQDEDRGQNEANRELALQIGQLVLDLGIAGEMPGFWRKLADFLDLPSNMQPKCALPAHLVLLGIPEWRKSSMGRPPFPRSAAVAPGPMPGFEEDLCKAFDLEVARVELEDDRQTLAWMQEHGTDVYPSWDSPDYLAELHTLETRISAREAVLKGQGAIGG